MPHRPRARAPRQPEPLRQGAVGTVRALEREGRRLVEKRMADPRRHDTEVAALRALAGSRLPVPELVEVSPGAILMSRLPGRRADELDPEARRRALTGSAVLLRRLHELPVPTGAAAADLPTAPDDAEILRRYRAAGGPELPLEVPPRSGTALCHGDWTDGNLLVTDGRITGIVDLEAAHLGDPLRDLSRAAWGASRTDPELLDRMVEAYGADPALVLPWCAIHAAELWLWFREAGPPEHLARLTRELEQGPPGSRGERSPTPRQIPPGGISSAS